MMRSIGAIVLGFVTIAALAFTADALVREFLPHAFSSTGRLESTPLLLFTQLYVAVFAIGGCYFTAVVAGNDPMRHALILGALGFVFNILGSISQWDAVPVWYHVLSLTLVLPYAWMGGRIRERQLERRGAPGGAVALA